jgi:hypothetical protein
MGPTPIRSQRQALRAAMARTSTMSMSVRASARSSAPPIGQNRTGVHISMTVPAK